jgi:hypothetical protein
MLPVVQSEEAPKAVQDCKRSRVKNEKVVKIMSETVPPTVTMFALRKKGSNAPHLAATSWGSFVEPIEEKAAASDDLEVVRVTVEPVTGEPYNPTPSDETDYWKKAAMYFANVHAANAEGVLTCKATKSARRRMKSVVEYCASILKGVWPKEGRAPITVSFDAVVKRCDDAVAAFDQKPAKPQAVQAQPLPEDQEPEAGSPETDGEEN